MAVIDCFTYDGEKEMLEIHLNCLDEYVDRFVIVEAKTTFSGNKKPLYFSEQGRFFAKWWKKIDYYVIDDHYSEEEKMLAENSPNTKGASHWKREFMQKESIHKALCYAQVKDDDIIYIGDVDEIWRPFVPEDGPIKLKLHVYAYYLDNLSNEEFWGTLVSYYKDIKGKCLNHLRSSESWRMQDYYGCHFTSMGGLNEVRRKLNDSYTQESYNTNEVQEFLEERMANGIDYLGRPFTFKKDIIYWPLWLQVNKNEYKHLCISQK